MTNMATIFELSSDESLSIERGWDWGDFAGGVAYSLREVSPTNS